MNSTSVVSRDESTCRLSNCVRLPESSISLYLAMLAVCPDTGNDTSLACHATYHGAATESRHRIHMAIGGKCRCNPCQKSVDYYTVPNVEVVPEEPCEGPRFH